MAQNIEIEFKNTLTEQEFKTLLHFFNLQEGKEHINIYFDTLQLDFKKNKSSLRARIKTNEIELTLKEQRNNENIETTDIISENQLNMLIQDQILILGHVSERINKMKIISPIHEIARLTTIRYEVYYLDQLIALDHSTYYDITDYEIELETDDYITGKQIFEKLLTDFNIPKSESKHKITRALEHKKTR